MGNDTVRRRKATGRSAATYLGIPHYVVRSEEFGQLGAWELKLLVELAAQYNGYNNGDFSAAMSILRTRGWHSTGTLSKALAKLRDGGWIVTTRHGHRGGLCALYAVTWWPIDDCDGKWLELPAERSARNTWQAAKKSISRYVNSNSRYVNSQPGKLAKK